MRAPTILSCITSLVLAMATVGPAFGQTFTPARTPDGQPDIQGTWINFDSTPFEARLEERVAQPA
jgi:hypothetical protein